MKIFNLLSITLFIMSFVIYKENKGKLDLKEFKSLLEDMINNNLTYNQCELNYQKYLLEEKDDDSNLTTLLSQIVFTDFFTVDDYKCDAIKEKATQEQCNSLTSQIFVDGIFKCCMVYVKIDNSDGFYENKFCMKIADTKEALEDVKKSFKHASKVTIECHSFYLSLKNKMLIFAILAFIVF